MVYTKSNQNCGKQSHGQTNSPAGNPHTKPINERHDHKTSSNVTILEKVHHVLCAVPAVQIGTVASKLMAKPTRYPETLK